MRKAIVFGTLVLIAAAGWYVFRPDTLFTNKTVNETFAPATLAALASGRFHSNAHETSGSANILDLGAGRRLLRLTEFETSNGPDLRIYLVAADDANDNATVKTAGFVELGALKGNRGDQTYEIPTTVDLTRFRTVTIWCRRFNVNFGSAPLVRN